MAELIREEKWREYKAEVRRIKRKWEAIYGSTKARKWFGI